MTCGATWSKPPAQAGTTQSFLPRITSRPYNLCKNVPSAGLLYPPGLWAFKSSKYLHTQKRPWNYPEIISNYRTMSTKHQKARLDKQMTNGYKMFSLVYLLFPCIKNKHANLKSSWLRQYSCFSFFSIWSTHKFIKDSTYKSRKIGNMLFFHYLMVINIRQEYKLVLIS